MIFLHAIPAILLFLLHILFLYSSWRIIKRGRTPGTWDTFLKTWSLRLYPLVLLSAVPGIFQNIWPLSHILFLSLPVLILMFVSIFRKIKKRFQWLLPLKLGLAYMLIAASAVYQLFYTYLR